MSQLRKAAKLVAVNIFVFLVMIWSLNLVASLIIDGKFVYRKWFAPADEKATRAVFEDKDHARAVFHEFHLLRTRYVPYLAWSREAFHGETTNVNADGDRYHAPTTEDPVGHVRFFGGSTMWGKGVDDENTIPAHFNARHPDYEVHNHGESGFVGRQEQNRLINLVNQDAPMDLVVFYDGCNDAQTLCRSDISINGHSNENKIAAKMTPGSHAVENLIGSLRQGARSIARKLDIAEGAVSRCQAEPAYARQVAATMVNNWKIARQAALLAGAEFHAVLQPVASIGAPNVAYLSDRRKGARARDYRLVYPLVQEIMEQEQADWMHDLTDAFDVDDYVYIDTCHVNARGNQIIAERIDAIVGGRLRQGGQ